MNEQEPKRGRGPDRQPRKKRGIAPPSAYTRTAGERTERRPGGLVSPVVAERIDKEGRRLYWIERVERCIRRLIKLEKGDSIPNDDF